MLTIMRSVTGEEDGGGQWQEVDREVEGTEEEDERMEMSEVRMVEGEGRGGGRWRGGKRLALKKS